MLMAASVFVGVGILVSGGPYDFFQLVDGVIKNVATASVLWVQRLL